MKNLDREARVVYTPLIEEGASVPFYYPKVKKNIAIVIFIFCYWRFWQVKAYSFVYDAGTDEEFG